MDARRQHQGGEAVDQLQWGEDLRTTRQHARFLRRFYTLFLASAKTVADKFAHTDLRRQASMLRTSLYIMMLAGGESERQVWNGSPGVTAELIWTSSRNSTTCGSSG